MRCVTLARGQHKQRKQISEDVLSIVICHLRHLYTWKSDNIVVTRPTSSVLRLRDCWTWGLRGGRRRLLAEARPAR